MWEAGDEVMCPLTAQQVPNVCALPHQVPTPTMSKAQCLNGIKKKKKQCFTQSPIPLKIATEGLSPIGLFNALI